MTVLFQILFNPFNSEHHPQLLNRTELNGLKISSLMDLLMAQMRLHAAVQTLVIAKSGKLCL